MARAKYNGQYITGHWACINDEYYFVTQTGELILIDKLSAYDSLPWVEYTSYLQDAQRKKFEEESNESSDKL